MIRLGVIGYGSRMRKVIQEIDRYNAGTRIVGLVDPQGPRLKEAYPALSDAVLYPDADAMLDTETLDGILIGTRCFLHTPYALKVLARGLPLWLEKPVAITWEQLAELRTA